VRGYVCLAECLDDARVRGEAFNFSSERAMTVLELVRTIQTLMDCAHITPDIRSDTEGEIRSQYLSAAKARQLLKWEPAFDLETTLRETIAWYRALFTGQR